MKKLSCILLSMLWLCNGIAQNSNDAWQNNLAESIFHPEIKGWQIYTGGQGFTYHSPFPARNLFKNRAEGGVEISTSGILDQLKEDNLGVLDAEAYTLGVSWSKKDMSFSLGHRVRYAGSLRYSEELVRLLDAGNEPFIGERIEVGPGFNYMHYHELYAGGSYIMDGLVIGGRLKLISGNEMVMTESDRINLTTEESFFAIDFQNNYEVVSSNLFFYNGLDDVTVDLDRYRFNGFFSDNVGVGIDLGIKIEVGDNAHLSIVATDLGKINWTENTRRYESQGNFSYDGIDLLDFLREGDDVSITDSLYNLLQFTEEINQAISVSLPSSFQVEYRSAHAQGSFWSISGFINRYGSSTLGGFMAGYVHRLSDRWKLSGRYRYAGSTWDNVGIGLSYHTETVVIQAVTDNVFSLINPIRRKYNGGSLRIAYKIN